MVSLVVLNYNDFETTENFVLQIQNFDSIDHIVVVDNASSDGSFEKLSRHSSGKISVIQTKENLGYSGGNNFGIRFSKEHFQDRFIIIANPDVILENSDINTLCYELDKNEDIAIISGVMKKKNGTVFENFANKLPTFRELLIGNLLLLRVFLSKINKKKNFTSNIQNNRFIFCDYVPGSFFIAKSDIFEKAGLFDERTFLYYEECILGYKIKNLGYRECVLTSCSYIHNHGVSIKKSITKFRALERIARESAEVYLSVIGVSDKKIRLFALINKVTFIERFLFYKIRSLFKNKE